jgi:hypothetical protein
MQLIVTVESKVIFTLPNGKALVKMIGMPFPSGNVELISGRVVEAAFEG